MSGPVIVSVRRAKWLLAAVAVLCPLASHSEVIGLQEFVRGTKSVYSSEANPKAKGLRLSIEYPRSWAGRDGRRPNIVHGMVSENGRGLESCTLSVNYLPLNPGERVSSRDLDEILSPAGLRQFVPAGAVYVQGARTTIDGSPAGWLIYQQLVDRAGLQIQMRWISFPVFYDRHLVTVGCSVSEGADAGEERLVQHFQAYVSLFRHIAASLVVQNRWQR